MSFSCATCLRTSPRSMSCVCVGILVFPSRPSAVAAPSTDRSPVAPASHSRAAAPAAHRSPGRVPRSAPCRGSTTPGRRPPSAAVRSRGPGRSPAPASREPLVVARAVELPVQPGRAHFQDVGARSEVLEVQDRRRLPREARAALQRHAVGVIEDEAQQSAVELDLAAARSLRRRRSAAARFRSSGSGRTPRSSVRCRPAHSSRSADPATALQQKSGPKSPLPPATPNPLDGLHRRRSRPIIGERPPPFKAAEPPNGALAGRFASARSARSCAARSAFGGEYCRAREACLAAGASRGSRAAPDARKDPAPNEDHAQPAARDPRPDRRGARRRHDPRRRRQAHAGRLLRRRPRSGSRWASGAGHASLPSFADLAEAVLPAVVHGARGDHRQPADPRGNPVRVLLRPAASRATAGASRAGVPRRGRRQRIRGRRPTAGS